MVLKPRLVERKGKMYKTSRCYGGGGRHGNEAQRSEKGVTR